MFSIAFFPRSPGTLVQKSKSPLTKLGSPWGCSYKNYEWIKWLYFLAGFWLVTPHLRLQQTCFLSPSFLNVCHKNYNLAEHFPLTELQPQKPFTDSASFRSISSSSIFLAMNLSQVWSIPQQSDWLIRQQSHQSDQSHRPRDRAPQWAISGENPQVGHDMQIMAAITRWRPWFAYHGVSKKWERKKTENGIKIVGKKLRTIDGCAMNQDVE